MSMNGIDIASHQAGINLAAVPCDFVIVKATEGTTYVNPYCNMHVGQTLNLGKKLGLYHFASGGDANAEADYFVDNIKGYLGKALLVLDWEADAVNRGVAWAKTWLDRVQRRTGVKPLIYMSNSVVNAYDWSSVSSANYGLWNAGYYAGYETMGYNPQAPLIGGTGAWGGAAIYQYTSSGSLDGWGGDLDLDVFYGDGKAWDAYAGAKSMADSGPKQVAGDPVNDFGLWYRAHVEKLGWLAPVHDGQVAGTTGYGLRLEALKIDTRKLLGVRLKASAHIQGIGTVDYGYIDHDTIIGTVGQSKRLEAVMLEFEGLPNGKKVYIQMHFDKDGWGRVVPGGDAGSFGLGKEAQAIKLWIA